MAREVALDPFQQFRFCPRIGYDGIYVGTSRVSIKPGNPWQEAGEVEFEAMLGPAIVEFAKLADPLVLTIGLYNRNDGFGPDEEPSGSIVLTNVSPSQGDVSITELDASQSDVVKMTIRMKYDRLTFVFNGNVLDKIAAVI